MRVSRTQLFKNKKQCPVKNNASEKGILNGMVLQDTSCKKSQQLLHVENLYIKIVCNNGENMCVG